MVLLLVGRLWLEMNDKDVCKVLLRFSGKAGRAPHQHTGSRGSLLPSLTHAPQERPQARRFRSHPGPLDNWERKLSVQAEPGKVCKGPALLLVRSEQPVGMRRRLKGPAFCRDTSSCGGGDLTSPFGHRSTVSSPVNPTNRLI